MANSFYEIKVAQKQIDYKELSELLSDEHMHN